MDIFFNYAEILRDNWAVRIGFIVFLSLIAFFLWSIFYRLMRWMAHKTSLVIVDILLVTAYLPVLFVFVLLTFYACIAFLAAEQTWINFPSSTLFRPYVFTIALFWWLLRFADRLERALLTEQTGHLLSKLAKKIQQEPAILYSTMFILRTGVIIALLLSLLHMSGISLAGILAFGGVGGIILGFALKDPLANFFSGVLIFLERPFVIGEWVRCPSVGIEGTVEQIGWRITRLRTFNKRPVYVPNSIFMENYIETPQRMTHRRIDERIGLRYGDIIKLPQILQNIRTMLHARDDIDKQQKPLVIFERYGDHALIIWIVAMTNSVDWYAYNYTKEDILLNIAKIVAEHKADFAFPTRTLHIKKDPLMNDEQMERNDG